MSSSGDNHQIPSVPVAVVTSLIAVAAMAALHLWAFPSVPLPVSYALVLLLALWHQNRRLLWINVALLSVIAGCKIADVLPYIHGVEDWLLLAARLVNVFVIAGVLHIWIGAHRLLKQRKAEVELANAELETVNEELRARRGNYSAI